VHTVYLVVMLKKLYICAATDDLFGCIPVFNDMSAYAVARFVRVCMVEELVP